MNVGIILAAGVGSRFRSDKPKQFFLLNGKPVVYYTIKSFVDCGLFDKIVVVLSKPYMKLGNKILTQFFSDRDDILLCEGGETRQDSLYNGVRFIIDSFGEEDFKVVSHCAARPLLSKTVLGSNLDMVERGKSVDTVRRIYDTMLYMDTQGVPGFIDRDRVFVGLTPQSFFARDYISAYHSVKERIKEFTCACSLMKGAGHEIVLYMTEEPIHKITVKEDVNIIKQQIKGWVYEKQ